MSAARSLLLLLLGCCCFGCDAFIASTSSSYPSFPGILIRSQPVLSTSATLIKSSVLDAPTVDAPLIICEREPVQQQQQQQQQLRENFLSGDDSKPRDTSKGGVFGVPPWALAKMIRVSCAMLSAFSVLRFVATSSRWSNILAASLPARNHKFFQTGFYEAFTLVSLSEIGDKSFFAAGLLALRTSRLVSFVGSFGALVVMTLISVGLGRVFHTAQHLPGFGMPGLRLLSGLPLDDVAAAAAFTFFGIKTLREATTPSATDGDASKIGADEPFELAEANELVSSSGGGGSSIWSQIASVFGLIFAAEFGDRSFLATVALASAQSPVGVALGAVVAHSLTTIAAVWGASYIAQHISEKAINMIGGMLFLVFAFTTAFGIF